MSFVRPSLVTYYSPSLPTYVQIDLRWILVQLCETDCGSMWFILLLDYPPWIVIIYAPSLGTSISAMESSPLSIKIYTNLLLLPFISIYRPFDFLIKFFIEW